MLTHARDLLVLFTASFFCPKFVFLFDVHGLVKRSWLWEIKIYVWQFRSCVQFRRRWQAIIRKDPRLQMLVSGRAIKLSRPEVLLTFFELLCK